LINYLLIPKNIICTIVNLNVKSWLCYYNMRVENNKGDLTNNMFTKYLNKIYDKLSLITNEIDRTKCIIKIFDFLLKHKHIVYKELSIALAKIDLLIGEVEQRTPEYIVQCIIIKYTLSSF